MHFDKGTKNITDIKVAVKIFEAPKTYQKSFNILFV